MAFTVWLVVQIAIAGAPPFIVEHGQYPSVAACAARAIEILDRTATIPGGDGFEIAATCSVAKSMETPAKEQQ